MNIILVPLDGSALAEHVLPYVRGLASLLGAKVRLLQVLSDLERDSLLTNSVVGFYSVGESPEAYQERLQRTWETLRQHAEGYLASPMLRLQEAGLEVEADVRIGPPDKIIVEVAREQHATLIAMATHGYGGLKRWMLGSITHKVVHTATAPVFVVHGAEPAPPAVPTIKRILVPLDGSECARQALPLATDLATCANAELILLEAIAPVFEARPGFRPLGRPIRQYGEILELLHWQAQQDLGTLADQLRLRGLRVRTVVMNGHAAEVIDAEATRREVDLIVMATHGYGGLRRWALGSVAHKVLHTATMPLVLVRAEGIEDQAETGTWKSQDAPSSFLVRP